jgi:hypothetical protein
MNQQRWEGKIITLSILVILGIAYSSFVYSQHTLTGMNHLDGIIGVVLGLYICSHPAANLVDMFFYRRGIQHPFSLRQFTLLWVAINVMVLFIGGIVIFTGTTQLIGKAD